MTSRRKVLAAAAVAALAAGAGVAALRAGRDAPSDPELVRALFEDAAKAAEERRVGDAVEGVSEAFAGHGLDKAGVKRLVAFHVLRGEWVSVSISGARVAVEGDRALANVDAVLARGSAKGKSLAALLPGEASAHRFRCRLRREPEGWRIVEADWRAVGLAEAVEGPPEPAWPAAGGR
jgi:hypothetical protein